MRSDCKLLHETILKDVIDVIDGVKDIKDDTDKWFSNKSHNYGSIARRAKNFILTFPVITTTSISIQTASILSKAIERKCVSLLQILFSSVQFNDEDENLFSYLQKFHTNLDLQSDFSLDNFMLAMDKMAEDAVITITNKEIYEAVREDMQNINFAINTNLNETSINDYKLRTNVYGESTIIHEKKYNRNGNGNNGGRKITMGGANSNPGSYFDDEIIEDLRKASDRLDKQQTAMFNAINDINKTNAGLGQNIQDLRDTQKDMGNKFNQATKTADKAAQAAAQASRDAQRASDTVNRFNQRMPKDIENQINASVKKLYNARQDGMSKNQIDYFRYQLLPQDVSKANELQPTIMMVNFTYIKDGVKFNTNGIIGVKAKLYPVDDMEVINRIANKVVDKNGLFSLVRATTREVSFFKDFVFALNRIKFDAINMAKQSNNAKMFRLLERRALKNKLNILMKKNNASPITTLIISQQDAEYLKKYNNIDIEKPNNAKVILEAYNLMGICIADETLEIARFMYDDGDGIYEAYSFDAMEKESKDGSYKKVVNLMSKMNR